MTMLFCQRLLHAAVWALITMHYQRYEHGKCFTDERQWKYLMSPHLGHVLLTMSWIDSTSFLHTSLATMTFLVSQPSVATFSSYICQSRSRLAVCFCWCQACVCLREQHCLRLTFPRAKLRRQFSMTPAEVWAKNWAKFGANFSGHFRASFSVQSDPPKFFPKFLPIYHSMSCQDSCCRNLKTSSPRA